MKTTRKKTLPVHTSPLCPCGAMATWREYPVGEKPRYMCNKCRRLTKGEKDPTEPKDNEQRFRADIDELGLDGWVF